MTLAVSMCDPLEIGGSSKDFQRDDGGSSKDFHLGNANAHGHAEVDAAGNGRDLDSDLVGG